MVDLKIYRTGGVCCDWMQKL